MVIRVNVRLLFLVLFVNSIDSTTWDAGKVTTVDGKKVVTVTVETSRADTVRASMGYSFKDFNVFMNKVYCLTKCQDRLFSPKQRVQVRWEESENVCVCTLDEPPPEDAK